MCGITLRRRKQTQTRQQRPPPPPPTPRSFIVWLCCLSSNMFPMKTIASVFNNAHSLREVRLITAAAAAAASLERVSPNLVGSRIYFKSTFFFSRGREKLGSFLRHRRRRLAIPSRDCFNPPSGACVCVQIIYLESKHGAGLLNVHLGALREKSPLFFLL